MERGGTYLRQPDLIALSEEGLRVSQEGFELLDCGSDDSLTDCLLLFLRLGAAEFEHCQLLCLVSIIGNPSISQKRDIISFRPLHCVLSLAPSLALGL